jgi:hypothetical protein
MIRWIHQSAKEYFKIRREDLFPDTREEIMEIRPEWAGCGACVQAKQKNCQPNN